jgi:hypothetical protein
MIPFFLLILSGHLGNADMVQPGLIPLQPNLDFMDTFEPFQGEDGAERTWLLDLPCPAQGKMILSFQREDV